MPETTSDHTGKESTPATIDSDRSTTSAADHPMTSSVGKSSSTPKTDLETDKRQPSTYTKETPISTPAKATDITDLSQGIHTSQTSTAPLSDVTPVSATQRSSPVPVGKHPEYHKLLLLSLETPVSTPAKAIDITDLSKAIHTSTTSTTPLSGVTLVSISQDHHLIQWEKPPEYHKLLLLALETPVTTPAKATDITDLSQGIHTSKTSTTPLSGVTPVSTSQRSSPVPDGKTSGMPETTSFRTNRSGKESTPATIDSDRSTTSAADHPITSSVGKSSSTPKANLETDKTQPSSYTKETPISKPAKATDITDSSQGINTSPTSTAPLSGVTLVSATQRSPVPVEKTSGIPQPTSALTDRSGKESTPATIDSDRSTTSAADHPITSSVGKSSSTPKADLETDKTLPLSYTKETPVSTPAKAKDITDLSQGIHTSQTSSAPLSDRSGKESTPATIDSDRSTTSAADHPMTSSVGKSSSTPKTDLETDKRQPSTYTKETPISTPAKATDITDLSQGIHTSQTSTAPLSDVTPVSATQRSSPVPVGKTSRIPQTTSALTGKLF
ncbi:uncharacterized protein [Ptychodera flava]|uniref:uncharacterized protein n=1 Tax=Ptychodera flava TaxID=63121 RepID=UPI00396AA668